MENTLSPRQRKVLDFIVAQQRAGTTPKDFRGLERTMKKKKPCPDVVIAFSTARQCEYCHDVGTMEAHHIFSRGAGRVDLAINLVSLCRSCHTGFHTSGKPSRVELLEIAAKREGTTAEAIEMEVYRVRRENILKK